MKKRKRFIGRAQELTDLERFLTKKSAGFVVVTGRRRVGKSRLIEEFVGSYKALKFSALPPTQEMTAQDQRDLFATQLSEQTGLPEFKTDDWYKLFMLLGKESNSGQIIIVLDEISWMTSKDPTFLPKLKVIWDEVLSKNSRLLLILCGSVSTWVEKNILSSTGYFGRVAHRFHLEPLTLNEANQMLESQGFKRSAYEKLKLLSVLGCIPWYLEQVDGKLSADDNIKEVAFRKGSLLSTEFDSIFHDLFESRDAIYKKIVEELASGSASFDQLCERLNYANSGTMTEYLDELIKAGFVQRDFTWSLKTARKGLLSRYRLSDNYSRFYLKCVLPRKDQIDRDFYARESLAALANWDSIMGLQFENLILNNRPLIFRELGIRPVEQLLQDGPFFQRKTTRQKGVQIDYLIQTRQKTSFLCEIKFSQNPLDSSVIKEVQQKIDALSLPRAQSCLPLLIHVNGVTDSVLASMFFEKIIDLAELLLKED